MLCSLALRGRAPRSRVSSCLLEQRHQISRPDLCLATTIELYDVPARGQVELLHHARGSVHLELGLQALQLHAVSKEKVGRAPVQDPAQVDCPDLCLATTVEFDDAPAVSRSD